VPAGYTCSVTTRIPAARSTGATGRPTARATA
jgi:hypothetical protein